MKKQIKNLVTLALAAIAVLLIPVFLTHHTPSAVEIAQLDAQEIAEQKEASARAEKKAQQTARIRRMYACQTDEDCVIVDKDPCGCAAGPEGVTAVNVDRITDFQKMNNANSSVKACATTLSTERECSASAHAVCKANQCKIAY